MKSFRTELENPVVEQDILELEQKIAAFHKGEIDEEKFRSLRLARGVYGQRQPGVQMIRIKLPYGKVNAAQLRSIAEVSDEYSTGKLHITTRQDIQIHYVNLDRTPELWARLEKDQVTLREACGNTVRNVTASPWAGVDPDEPFDVTPYADASFRYFLRNPICQEMGRKFKISFSSSQSDSALSYMHDLGFIPVVHQGKHGFVVMLGGGLGSQAAEAHKVYDFLPTGLLIPFTEAVLRVFDRYGERNKRMKARLKFLIKDVGVEQFLKWVDQEREGLPHPTFPIEYVAHEVSVPHTVLPKSSKDKSLENNSDYKVWLSTNVKPQKQEGYFAINVRVALGDFSSQTARYLADLISEYAGNEIRFTINQGMVIRDVPENALHFFYEQLQKLNLADAGFGSPLDITACPGTDTCNLGIASSTGLAAELTRVMELDYPELVNNQDIQIKISGCMNSCGQHMMAQIGFQGMTLKSGQLIAPATQVLLGGGTLGHGKGRYGDKVIKLPSKRVPEALRRILEHYQEEAQEGEYFNDYYDRFGKKFFYDLLKDLADATHLTQDDFVDWGSDNSYVKAIGVGECAGVIIDLVATLFLEGEEKLLLAQRAFNEQRFADSVYHAYAGMIHTAKALLTTTEHKYNTHAAIIKVFDEEFVQTTGQFNLPKGFANTVLQIKSHKPDASFAETYLSEARAFQAQANAYRSQQLAS